MLSTTFFCLFLCSQIQSQNVSSYPSDIKLRPYVQTLKSVVDQLEAVKRDGIKRLELVREYLDNYTCKHASLLRGGQLYLKNPINRFIFMYGLTKELDFLGEVVKERREFKIDTSLQYPTLEDMEIDVLVLSRLQRFYLLNVTQLAAGILNTSYSESEVYVEYFSKITSSDCYTIGKIMCKYQQYTQGVLWLAEALMMYERDKVISEFDKREIYLSLANASESLNDSIHFLNFTKELLSTNAEDIDDRRIAQDIIAYQSKWISEREAQSKRKILNMPQEINAILKDEETGNYRRHCRGEIRVPPDITKRLKCWYFTGYHPFLRLAPIRTEQLYIKPDIFQHYDVITNREIKDIKSVEPKLQKCIIRPALYACENSTVQICHDDISIRQCMTNMTLVAETMAQRIFDFTGLWSTHKLLYATYYSYGGHFFPHLDSYRPIPYIICADKLKSTLASLGLPSIKLTPTGIQRTPKQMSVIHNLCLYREQTLLFYLSNVAQGGATVFPLLGVTVFPRKGSVLSWTTMYGTKKENDVTIHSACPVLRGNKWVATKWINFDGNELKRPCVDQFPNRDPKNTPPPVLKEEYFK